MHGRRKDVQMRGNDGAGRAKCVEMMSLEVREREAGGKRWTREADTDRDWRVRGRRSTGGQ
jgi:hypothetical protein